MNTILLRKLIIKGIEMWYKSEQKKKRLRDNARDKCRNLSEEEKNVKKEYGRNRYNNISEKKRNKS